jgi:hypothetical protein
MREDELSLFPYGGSGVQMVRIKRGFFQLHPSALSYVNGDDVESGARTYLNLDGLERWKVTDHSRTAD